jgi:serine/threonine protein kinase
VGNDFNLNSTRFLVLEYAQKGELFDYLISKGPLDNQQALKFFQQILEGLDYLHRHNIWYNKTKSIPTFSSNKLPNLIFKISHRDLKPENILFSKKNKIKFCDFGLSFFGINNYPVEYRPKLLYSLLYRPPELFENIPKEHYTLKCDIWSLGAIFYELENKKILFKQLKKNPTKEGIENILKNTVKFSKDEKFNDLISNMLKMNVNERYDIYDVLKHPFFNKKIKKNKIKKKIEDIINLEDIPNICDDEFINKFHKNIFIKCMDQYDVCDENIKTVSMYCYYIIMSFLHTMDISVTYPEILENILKIIDYNPIL